tara:strand:+ start:11534 stop:12175 length:642 start_codon:yes stop_codon:yes gene_type:complete
MILTLSGYEGSGKSTLVEMLKEKNNFLVVPETARLLIPLENTVFEESKDELSYKSFIAYLGSSHFIFENNLAEKNSVVFDRNIIDSLTYLELYSDQNIDLVKLQDYIDMFLEDKNQKTLYDEVLLLNHSKDKDYIRNTIMADDVRLYSDSPNKYLEKAKEWQDIYISKYDQLKNIGKRLSVIQSYPDNLNVKEDLNKVLKTSEKKVRKRLKMK